VARAAGVGARRTKPSRNPRRSRRNPGGRHDPGWTTPPSPCKAAGRSSAGGLPVVARTPEAAVRALRERRERPFHEAPKSASIAFLFPGQGAHYPAWPGPVRAMPEFTRPSTAPAELFRPLIGHDLREPGPAGRSPSAPRAEPGSSSRRSSPVEYALAQALIARGVTPAAMLGHSMGEVRRRGGERSVQPGGRRPGHRRPGPVHERRPRGGMLAVPMSEADVTPLLPAGVTVAAGQRTAARRGPPGTARRWKACGCPLAEVASLAVHCGSRTPRTHLPWTTPPSGSSPSCAPFRSGHRGSLHLERHRHVDHRRRGEVRRVLGAAHA